MSVSVSEARERRGIHTRDPSVYPTVEKLQGLFIYEPDSGKLYRRIFTSSRGPQGAEAGTDHHTGYRVVGIDGLKWGVHRLIWAMHYGWPELGVEIDHINGDGRDNRLSNLRLATRLQNSWNCRSRGTKGIYQEPGGRWIAHIQTAGVQKYLGWYRTQKEAKAAYDAEALRTRGEFACL